MRGPSVLYYVHTLMVYGCVLCKKKTIFKSECLRHCVLYLESLEISLGVFFYCCSYAFNGKYNVVQEKTFISELCFHVRFKTEKPGYLVVDAR